MHLTSPAASNVPFSSSTAAPPSAGASESPAVAQAFRAVRPPQAGFAIGLAIASMFLMILSPAACAFAHHELKGISAGRIDRKGGDWVRLAFATAIVVMVAAVLVAADKYDHPMRYR